MLRRFRKFFHNMCSYLKAGGVIYIDKVNPMCFEDRALFKNRTVLITGGGSGIGKALAVGLAEQGAQVIITGRTETKLRDVAGINSNIKYMVWDVSDVEIVNSKMHEAFERFGLIDTLVNCAGIYRYNDIQSMDEKTYDEVMDINVKGTYFFTKAFIDNHRDSNDVLKKIINVCSVRSFTTNTTSYALSKHALKCFTEGLAKELKFDNYMVNGIAPGPTVSEINYNNNVGENGNLYTPGKKRMRRLLSVDEVVNVAKFLVSDFSNGINGQIIIVDGGETSVD